MMEEERRKFLATGRGLVLGALTAGTLMACAGEPETLHGQTTTTNTSQPYSATFGWEINNLGIGGGAVYVKVLSNAVLDVVDVDVSFSPLSAPAQPGFSDVLCRGQVSRSGPPLLKGSEVNFFPPSNSQFGVLQTFNPGGLDLVADAQPFQDTFLSVILKAWITADATASQTARHVTVSPSIALNAGDYLVFTMSGGAVTVDAEMQIILFLH